MNTMIGRHEPQAALLLQLTTRKFSLFLFQFKGGPLITSCFVATTYSKNKIIKSLFSIINHKNTTPSSDHLKIR